MPVDYYPQKTEAELLALLVSLQNRQTQGHVYMTGGAGIQTVRSFTGSSRVEVEIRRVLYSLHLRNAEDYEDPYASRIRRTRAYYQFS